MVDAVGNAKVNSLSGYNADKIASFLHLVDVKGKKNAASSCPVANYIGGAHVTSTQIKFKDGSVITTPANIRDFVLKFDEGKYPLVEEK